VDRRTPAQRDRDRILYASSFRRLAGITQVVSPTEGHVFHNRLTHTLKVGQIGRCLAEKLLIEQNELAMRLGGLDPDVVEAAALAHDLGHPPFGHIAEETLSTFLDASPEATHAGSTGVVPGEGFEGNAQSFRIVTTLAVHHEEYGGLNLTRATLAALLKYPWLRGAEGKQRHKWGAYGSDSAALTWAREAYGPADQHKSAEAELMDWADDITYSVHDAEDFYRAGLIPLHDLVRETAERQRFLDRSLQRLRDNGIASQYTDDELRSSFGDVIQAFPLTEPFRGTRGHRAALRSFSSVLIGRFVDALRLADPALNAGERVTITRQRKMEVTMLKELTWYYIINNPLLATQQHGQREVIMAIP